MYDITGLFGAGALAVIGAFIMVFLLVAIAIYVFFALALMEIARKTKTKNGWLAFIPIGNVYLMTQIAKVPGWWTIGVLLALIPFVGAVFVLILMTYLWWQIAERIKRPGWWSILLLIPIVNFVIMGMMAWGKK